MSNLTADKRMISDLWLDQPDAHDQIDARVDRGLVSAADAQLLRSFVDNGYLTTSLPLSSEFAAAFEADVERLFTERPADLAIAAKSGDRVSFRDFEETYEASRGYRIADMHSHSELALGLYLNTEIFRLVRLIFGSTPIAFQSLYFQFGSEQALHRDPMFVVTQPPSHLCAAWIALEDITPESGPLIYAPGSHRLPWFEFEPDTVFVASKNQPNAQAKRAEWVEERQRMLREFGLDVVEFTPKRGDVFIWHGGLLHGGARRRDENSTRKSFVVHYSTADTYRSRRASTKARTAAGEWAAVSGTTQRVLERNGCLGMDNPLRATPLAG